MVEMVETLTVISSLVLMIFLFPWLLKLKPNSNIKYLDVDEQSNLKLDNTINEKIDFVKLNKNEGGVSTSITIYPKDDTTYADFTIAYKTKNKIKVKDYKIKFKYGEEVTLDFKEPILSIAIYANRFNDGVKQQRIIQSLKRSNAEWFIALEWLVMAAATWIIVGFNLAYNSNFNLFGAGLYFIIIALLIGWYFLLHFVIFWSLGKYIYGGKFNA